MIYFLENFGEKNRLKIPFPYCDSFNLPKEEGKEYYEHTDKNFIQYFPNIARLRKTLLKDPQEKIKNLDLTYDIQNSEKNKIFRFNIYFRRRDINFYLSEDRDPFLYLGTFFDFGCENPSVQFEPHQIDMIDLYEILHKLSDMKRLLKDHVQTCEDKFNLL